MSKFYFFLLIFCSVSIACFGQPSPDWMVQHHIDILKIMRLEYKKPDGFKEVSGLECFKSWPQLAEIITCAGNQLHSDDGQFIAFIPVHRPFTEDDAVFIRKISPNGAFRGVDRMHEGNIRYDIELSLGKEAAENWRQYVHYYPSRKARRIFNADTAISLSIKLETQSYYQGKYNHLDALYLQREGRGHINFYCFYTDKAKKNFSTYWKAIEGVFRYKD